MSKRGVIKINSGPIEKDLRYTLDRMVEQLNEHLKDNNKAITELKIVDVRRGGISIMAKTIEIK